MRKQCKKLLYNRLRIVISNCILLCISISLIIALFSESLIASNKASWKTNLTKDTIIVENTNYHIKSKGAKIEVLNLKNNVARSFEIELIVNGEIADAGNCSPEPLLGVLKKNINGLWDTIVDIRKLGVGLCGIGNPVWSNDTIRVPFTTWKPVDQIEGLYRFTFFTYKRGKKIIKNSNEFEIVYIPD